MTQITNEFFHQQFTPYEETVNSYTDISEREGISIDKTLTMLWFIGDACKLLAQANNNPDILDKTIVLKKWSEKIDETIKVAIETLNKNEGVENSEEFLKTLGGFYQKWRFIFEEIFAEAMNGKYDISEMKIAINGFEIELERIRLKFPKACNKIVSSDLIPTVLKIQYKALFYLKEMIEQGFKPERSQIVDLIKSDASAEDFTKAGWRFGKYKIAEVRYTRCYLLGLGGPIDINVISTMMATRKNRFRIVSQNDEGIITIPSLKSIKNIPALAPEAPPAPFPMQTK